MSTPPESIQEPNAHLEQTGVEMPRPTIAPMLLALGMILLASGALFGLAFAVAGALILATSLTIWVGELLPGRGRFLELSDMSLRPEPVKAVLNKVEQLRPGMPGFRARLPEAVHPVSAGVKGGIVGGVVMPIPALLYGVISGHGIWFPVNLLAGMVLPNVGTLTDAQLDQFSLLMLITGTIIHATISVVFGLLYGVLLPMLPDIPRLKIPGSLAWGGIIFPILWTGATHSLMGVVNPLLQARVDWPWFVVSQFVFGIVAAIVVNQTEKVPVPPAGHGAGRAVQA